MEMKALGFKQITTDVSGLYHRQLKAFLSNIKSEYGDVTLCTALKFIGLDKVRFCNIFYHN